MKKIIFASILLFISVFVFAKMKKFEKKSKAKIAQQEIVIEDTTPKPPAELDCFIKGYPNATFTPEYDDEIGDWKITITSLGKTTALYWCGGKMLPKDEVKNQANYRINLWSYPEEIPDPKTMSPELIEGFKNFGSDENRSSGAITAPYFFDAIYDSETQRQTETHIVKMQLFGQNAKVHELIKPILETINDEVYELAKTDKEIADFISSLTYADSYFWRKIRDTNGKSFHSFGIAVDVLPKKLGNKAIYWSWEKARNPDGWMVLPLSQRWMPPQKVIDIFESHGFVWGGKWAVWDNMHFEYHPELFEYRKMGKGKGDYSDWHAN